MQIEKNKALDSINTFGLSATSKSFVSVKTLEELQEVILSKETQNNPVFILGGGSNILLTHDVEGLTIKIDIKGIEIIDQTDSHVIVQVGAGENWHEFVLYALEQGWGGIENLSLIPGTV
ncbi:MAG: FAD-binding protein, partial [Fulvivirga sp.]|nr:FAD-binding protein [Fulvivirga sp.]